MLYVQIIGRALRTADGKEDALILDHSDTTQRLGFVTNIHHEHLDDGKPATKAKAIEKKEALPKECDECTYLKPPKTPICPNCGHKNKITSSIMENDGELVELKQNQKTKSKGKKEYTEADRRVFFGELKAYALMHEYKPGWAAMKYKEKFKEWPPRWFDSVPPAEVLSPTVALWVRSRNIAWHKSKKNQGANA